MSDDLNILRQAISRISLLKVPESTMKIDEHAAYLTEPDNLTSLENSGLTPDPGRMSIVEIMDYTEKNGAWPEGMQAILERKNPRLVYDYAYLLKGMNHMDGLSWSEAEQIILSDPEVACLYSQDVRCKPWPEAEKIISESPEDAARYALNVTGKRWADRMVEYHILEHVEFEAKKYDLHDSESAKYRKRFIAGAEAKSLIEWGRRNYKNTVIVESEPIGYDWFTKEEFLENMHENPQELVWYAVAHKMTEWPEAEPYIAKNRNAAIHYAQLVLKGRFIDGEDAIFSSPFTALPYATRVLRHPYEEGSKGERAVLLSTHEAMQYAKHFDRVWPDPAINLIILKEYPPRGENSYLKSFRSVSEKEFKAWLVREFSIEEALHYPDLIITFCKYVLGGRWYDIEEFLKSISPSNYQQYVKEIIKR